VAKIKRNKEKIIGAIMRVFMIGTSYYDVMFLLIKPIEIILRKGKREQRDLFTCVVI